MLAMLLRKIQQAELVAVCKDGLEAMQVILQQEIDIVFTDINMPELSGINLLKSLKHPPVFIFISAFKDYATEGFDLDVTDFIVKPVSPQRLFKAFTKAKEHIDLRRSSDLPAPAISPGATATDFFAKTVEGLQKIVLADVAYIESKINFSILHLLDGNSRMILVGLKQLELQLEPENFIRIHKSYVVNWQLVSIIQPAGITIAGKYQLPIGESYRKAVAKKVAAGKMLERKPGN